MTTQEEGAPAPAVSGKKRGRTDQRATSSREAYDGFHFEAIESTGRPGTPHCYFDESYRIQCDSLSNSAVSPIVHKHANGLCVVTAGNLATVEGSHARIDSVELLAKPPTSGQEKREKATKKCKTQKESNNIRPTDVLAELCMKDGTRISLPSCVLGTIVEVNEKLSAELLARDSLLDGYLAVIRPAGPFPPKNRGNGKTNCLTSAVNAASQGK